MKINLAAKHNDVKDNYPPWYFNLHLKRKPDHIQYQEKKVDNDGSISQYHQGTLQPGKW